MAQKRYSNIACRDGQCFPGWSGSEHGASRDLGERSEASKIVCRVSTASEHHLCALLACSLTGLVLPSLPLGQEAKRQGIQLDRPTESLGVTCSEPRTEV
jgi:hypothetical protein